jgi:hypothetical protein
MILIALAVLNFFLGGYLMYCGFKNILPWQSLQIYDTWQETKFGSRYTAIIMGIILIVVGIGLILV